MTSSQPRLPCLRVIALRADTRKECGVHLTISAGDADSLRKRNLFSTFFVSARLSLGVDMTFLVSFTERLSIDIKDIASFIKLSSWFSSAFD